MSMIVKEMKCFKEIVEVIGEYYAIMELEKVVNYFKDKPYRIQPNKPLVYAFDWRKSPQNSLFWGKIWKGVVPKIKVEDLACFGEVEKVLGTSRAKRELFIALNNYEGWESNPVSISIGSLMGSFAWSKTPQKREFWEEVMLGRDPNNTIE